MCDNGVSTHPSTIQFSPECFTTQEMCDKAVNRCFLYLILFLINIKLKKYVTVASLFISFFNIVLINVKLKKCVMKLLMIA